MWVAGMLFFEFYENVRTVRSGVERTDNIPCADRSAQVHPIGRRVNRRCHQIPADQGERSGVAEFHACHLLFATDGRALPKYTHSTGRCIWRECQKLKTGCWSEVNSNCRY